MHKYPWIQQLFCVQDQVLLKCNFPFPPLHQIKTLCTFQFRWTHIKMLYTINVSIPFLSFETTKSLYKMSVTHMEKNSWQCQGLDYNKSVQRNLLNEQMNFLNVYCWTMLLSALNFLRWNLVIMTMQQNNIFSMKMLLLTDTDT